jgi:predicted phosphodiesterase
MSSVLRRIGLIGDIHAEDASLALALSTLNDAGVDRVMAVGDIVDGRGDVDRCCELLMKANAAVVRGNHERWLLAGTMRELPDATMKVGGATRAFLEALPATLRFEAPRGEILLCHGLGDDDMVSFDETESGYGLFHDPTLAPLLEDERPRWILNGHTHRRAVHAAHNLAVVNAGTLYRFHDPCFALVDLALDEVTYFDLRDGRVARKSTTSIPPPRGLR